MTVFCPENRSNFVLKQKFGSASSFQGESAALTKGQEMNMNMGWSEDNPFKVSGKEPGVCIG